MQREGVKTRKRQAPNEPDATQHRAAQRTKDGSGAGTGPATAGLGQGAAEAAALEEQCSGAENEVRSTGWSVEGMNGSFSDFLFTDSKVRA